MKALERELSARFGTRVKAAMPLKELTSFQIGGPADLFINVEDETELMHAKAAAYRAGVPCFCLGAGTNLLISDRGMRGLVLRLGDGFKKINFDTDGVKVVAGAAAAFGTLVETVVGRGLEGLEFGEGIPGTVGGGLVMNAGAFGGEIAKVVTLVHGVTEAGTALAQRVRARHRLVVDVLRAIGVPAEAAEADAEGIEHHVSETTLKAFARFVQAHEEN